MKYILEHPIKGTAGSQKYETSIKWRNGILITDEPGKIGGKDIGPDPYTLLLSSLVTCTISTLRMYLELKAMPIATLEVEANMFHRLLPDGLSMHIERNITFGHQFDKDIKAKLLRVAENCPVSKILKGNIQINTTFTK